MLDRRTCGIKGPVHVTVWRHIYMAELAEILDMKRTAEHGEIVVHLVVL